MTVHPFKRKPGDEPAWLARCLKSDTGKPLPVVANAIEARAATPRSGTLSRSTKWRGLRS